MGTTLKYFERLAYMLTRGVHVADVAILSPQEPCVVDFERAKATSVPLAHALVERLAVSGTGGYSAPGERAPEQEFTLITGEDFPYERPKVRWESPIFHPNIMSPSEGGLVCVMALDHWTFDSDLLSFVRSLIDLINNPNPHDPLRTPTCAKAAEWFLGNM